RWHDLQAAPTARARNVPLAAEALHIARREALAPRVHLPSHPTPSEPPKRSSESRGEERQREKRLPANSERVHANQHVRVGQLATGNLHVREGDFLRKSDVDEEGFGILYAVHAFGTP